VSFHAVLKDPPDGDEPTVLVYGAGTIGLAAVAAVKVVKPKARILVIARYPQQVAAAKRLGVETFRGVRKHAMEHYVDLCASCEVDLGFLVTHRYPLDEWKAAFSTAIAKTTGCVKVAFAF
jgi:threonine dehydrogenase-like Zn-dependent dehydrogenase